MDHKTDTDSERAAFETFWTAERKRTWVESGCHINRGAEPSINWAEGSKENVWRGWKARASLAASAGSEPVTDAMIDAGKNALHNSGARGAREKVERIYRAMSAAARPSPPEGMVGGWISVDERLPDEVQAYGCESDDCLVLLPNKRRTCALLVRAASGPKWLDQDSRVVHPTHWMPVPAPPIAAGGGKDAG